MAMVYYGYDMLWYMDRCMSMWTAHGWYYYVKEDTGSSCNGYMILNANHVCVS